MLDPALFFAWISLSKYKENHFHSKGSRRYFVNFVLVFVISIFFFFAIGNYVLRIETWFREIFSDIA